MVASDGTATGPRPADELAIRGLVARYCMTVDDGRFGDFEALWADDARIHVMGATHSGRGAVRAFIEGAQPPKARGRHTTSSHLVTFDGAGRARGWADYVFFDARGAATNIGRYHDEYVRGDDGEWRFALREIVFRSGEPEVTATFP